MGAQAVVREPLLTSKQEKQHLEREIEAQQLPIVYRYSWSKIGQYWKYVSHLIRKPTMWFPNRFDTNPSVQAHQKMARGWLFWIKKVEALYFPCSENKGADQLRS